MKEEMAKIKLPVTTDGSIIFDFDGFAVDKRRASDVVSLVNSVPSLSRQVSDLQAENNRLKKAITTAVRQIENLKLPCGEDPESPQAIRNGHYMSIALNLRSSLSPVVPGGEK